MMKKWVAYEEAAQRVVSDMRALLGVVHVGDKQILSGVDGATYELDAVAWTDDAGSFLLIEAKRHNRGLTQDTINSIIYKFIKVGAGGAIVVTPMPLQRGAKKAADFDHVIHIKLSADSTPVDYLAEYMGKRFLGASISDTLIVKDECDAVVIKASKMA